MNNENIQKKTISPKVARSGSQTHRSKDASVGAHRHGKRCLFSMKSYKKLPKKKLYVVLLCVYAIVLVVSGSLLTNILVQRHQINNEERLSAMSAALISNEELPAAAPSGVAPLSPEFSRLLGINPDFIGIIRFADVSLYVCSGRDNMFYLNHQFDGSENSAGTIFLDASCVLDAENNYLLHGHNMKDGSRFGKLKRFLQIEYLLENPVFAFDTIRGSHEYRAAAVFKASFSNNDANYFDYQKVRFANEDEYNAYIMRAKKLSVYNTGFTPSYGKPLLVLSTCTDRDEERLVVLCGAVW